MSIPTPADERTPTPAESRGADTNPTTRGANTNSNTTGGGATPNPSSTATNAGVAAKANASDASASTNATVPATAATGVTADDLVGTPIGSPIWRRIAGIPERAPEGWVRPKPTSAERRIDLILGLVLGGCMALSAWSATAAGVYSEWTDETPLWAHIAFPVMAALTLSQRRAHPIAALIVGTIVFFSGFFVPYQELFITQLVYFVGFYSAGAWSRNRNLGAWTRLIIAAGSIAWVFVGIVASVVFGDVSTSEALSKGNSGAYAVFTMLANFTYYIGAYALGNIDYVRTGHAALATEQARVLREQRTKLADQAVKLDRVRIARELHDAVAHHVSLMGLQAAVARRSLPTGDDSTRAREQLEAVEANAREAIEELQGILATLRASESNMGMVPVAGVEPDHRTVSPSTRGVEQLPELVEQLRQAGMSLSFATVGDPQPLTQSADLSAYRIVQEALTNVRKHAGATATAEVRLRYGSERLEIDVTDDGFGPIGGATASTNVELTSGGRGILGMRERASAVGGTLEAGPRSDGGFRVRASLPLKGSRGLS